MVALALSLFLAAGVMKIYVNNKVSQEVQQVAGEMVDNQRSALEFISRDLRDAGFTNVPGLAIIDSTLSAEGANDSSDTIAINKQSATDCLGVGTEDDSGIATNTYFVNNGRLMCRGVKTVQPIADGVESMQILYGEDTDAITPGGIRTANRYVGKDDVINFGNVVSVRISILFRSSRPIVATAQEETYNLLDATPITVNNNIAAIAVADLDRFRRQVITSTISFRNNL